MLILVYAEDIGSERVRSKERESKRESKKWLALFEYW
jgi:hypothetical protein